LFNEWKELRNFKYNECFVNVGFGQYQRRWIPAVMGLAAGFSQERIYFVKGK